jgi:hypothetical protein
MREIATPSRVTPIRVRALGQFAIAFLLLAGGRAGAQVPAETDCWKTDPGTKAAVPFLPAGFLGAGCASFGPTQVPMTGAPLSAGQLALCNCPPLPQVAVGFHDSHGNAVAAGSIHAVSGRLVDEVPGPDSCVRRLATATFPGGVGVPETIPIELIQLSLVSVSPIQVNCGGPKFFNVYVTNVGVQDQGSMELTPTVVGAQAQGSVTVPSLPIDVQFRFEPTTPGSSVVLNASVNMQNPNPQNPGPPGDFQVLTAVPSASPPGIAIMVVLAMLMGVWALRRRAAAGTTP